MRAGGGASGPLGSQDHRGPSSAQRSVPVRFPLKSPDVTPTCVPFRRRITPCPAAPSPPPPHAPLLLAHVARTVTCPPESSVTIARREARPAKSSCALAPPGGLFPPPRLPPVPAIPASLSRRWPPPVIASSFRPLGCVRPPLQSPASTLAGSCGHDVSPARTGSGFAALTRPLTSAAAAASRAAKADRRFSSDALGPASPFSTTAQPVSQWRAAKTSGTSAAVRTARAWCKWSMRPS